MQELLEQTHRPLVIIEREHVIFGEVARDTPVVCARDDVLFVQDQIREGLRSILIIVV